MLVLLAHAIEDSTDIFGISVGGLNPPNHPSPPRYATAVPSLYLSEHLRTQHFKRNTVIQKHNTPYNMQPECGRSLYRGLSVPTDLSSHIQTSARCSCLPLWVIIGFYAQFSETTWKLSFLMSREICFQWAAHIITTVQLTKRRRSFRTTKPPETLHFRKEY